MSKKLFTEDYNQLSGEQPSRFLISYFACMLAHICVWVACSHAHTLFAIFPSDKVFPCSWFLFILIVFLSSHVASKSLRSHPASYLNPIVLELSSRCVWYIQPLSLALRI